MNEYIECNICNKKFKRITNTHLKTHGIINESKYLELYPNAILVSEQLCARLATNSLDHFIKIHGEENGPTKYDEYKKFQSFKNTFEYKHHHYGWTHKQFDEYNAARAVTLKNLENRHGKELGRKKFNDYRQLQRTAGVSLEYFQKKYGIEEGILMYKRVNKQKSHTLDNYKRLYGNLAEAKLTQFYEQLTMSPDFASKIQKEFIKQLCEKLPNDHLTYSIISGKEYVKCIELNNKVYMYDLVIVSPVKVVIEFNGNYWHCNPKMYDPNFIHPVTNISAKNIWQNDREKLFVLESEGFNSKVVWENDYNDDKCGTIDGIIEWIMNLQK